MIRRIFLAICLPLIAACAGVERLALPKASPLPDAPWAQPAPQSGPKVNYQPWDQFLTRYVKADGAGIHRVAYGAVSPADHQRLGAFVDALEKVDPATLSRDHQLAYWINLYNAATVQVVLDNYPVASIREISDRALSFGPWDRPLVVVAGKELSLNDIEHRIIRPTFKEPRIHYALNCAAAGCPNLMARAWRAKTLEADLAAAERAYVNDPRGVSFDAQGRLVVSKIYLWFWEDFADRPSGVIEYLKTPAAPALQARLDGVKKVSRYQYDWSLNGR